MNIYLLFAFLAPFTWGLMNFFDAYIVKRKVKNVFGFAVISGLTNILFGLILAAFLDWSSYSLWDLRFTILAGSALGVQLYFYYFLILRHDVSNAIGLMHIYPLVVAFLSFLFLNERLSAIGYFGVVIALSGVLMTTIRFRKLKLSLGIWSLFSVILTAALFDFFAKVSTFQIPEFHGAAINSIVMGMFLLPFLMSRGVRIGFKKELKNIKFTLVSEFLTILAILFTYLAVVGMPVTVFSVINVTQPIFVLFFEFIAFKLGLKIVKDVDYKNKTIAILLIVIGIALVYLSQ